MLRVILRSEWLRLLRSPLRLTAVLLYTGAGLVALQTGQDHVAVLESNLAEGAAREGRLQAQALGWFEEGRPGPDDRPWVDISQTLWADWYSGSHFGLDPVPLAAVSVGVSDVRSNMVRLSRLGTPFDAEEWRQLANPERQALGVMDLAFTFAFLLPLLVILVTFDLLGYERDRGLEGLLVLQAGRLDPWVRGRLLSVALVTGLPTLLLWVVAGALTGAIGEQTVGWLMGGGLVLAYLVMWLVLCGAVAVRTGSANRSALALAGLWIGFCVLVPSLINQVVSMAEPVGYSARITDAVRADRYALYEEPVEALLPAVYEEFPELQRLPYAAVEGERDPLVDRHVYDLASHLSVREAYGETAALERRRLELADRFMAVSPVYAFQSGLTRLAGTEASAYLRFGDAILGAVREKLRLILAYAWRGEPVDREGFKTIAAAVPENLAVSERPPILVWLTILGWTGAAFVFTRVDRVRRGRSR